MVPMNEPVFALLTAMKQGRNPQTVLRQMAGNDRRVAFVEQMIRGKSPRQLETIVRNMAQERGLNLEEMIRQVYAMR